MIQQKNGAFCLIDRQAKVDRQVIFKTYRRLVTHECMFLCVPCCFIRRSLLSDNNNNNKTPADTQGQCVHLNLCTCVCMCACVRVRTRAITVNIQNRHRNRRNSNIKKIGNKITTLHNEKHTHNRHAYMHADIYTQARTYAPVHIYIAYYMDLLSHSLKSHSTTKVSLCFPSCRKKHIFYNVHWTVT